MVSNIAEGQARGSDNEFARFLQISLGSLAEIDTQLVVAKELGYITVNDFESIEATILELRRMLYGLVRSLSKR